MPAALIELARRQAGAFTRDQALRHGLSDSALHRLVRRGLLRCLDTGVYAASTEPDSMPLGLWAALLAAGPPAAVAELAACAVHGLRDGSVAKPVIGVPAGRHPGVTPGARVRRLTFWDRMDVVERDGIPVLGMRDAILTAARVSSVSRLLALVQAASFEHGLDVAELLVRRRRGLPGSGRLGRALAIYLRGQDSAFEATTYRVLDQAGEAPDHTNVILVAPDGRRTGPWDEVWADGRVADLDGREAHRSAVARERDAAKTRRARALGLDAARWTSDDVAETGRFLAEVRRRRARVAGWSAERKAVVAQLIIEHLPGRGCVCGHEASRTMTHPERRGGKKGS